ncbi:unnamed protein product, partial [Rotaria sp. Silwood2]
CVTANFAALNTPYSISPPPTTYTCYAITWTSSKAGVANLTFSFNSQINYWYLDDVSMFRGTTNILLNGGFESGSWSPWIFIPPTCGSSLTNILNDSASAHSGNYCVQQRNSNCAESISQSVSVKNANSYTVTFWIKASGLKGGGPTATVNLA